MRYFLLFILLSFSFRAFACTCDDEPLTVAELAKYDLIFTGKVVAVSGCSKESQVKFLITKLYKGKAFESTEIQFDCTSDCSLSFAPDQTWIIYATYFEYGKAVVHFCSLSRMKIDDMANDHYAQERKLSFDEELSFLEKNLGVQPFNVIKVEDTQHHELLHPTPWQTILLLIASLAGLGVFYYVVKRMLK
ncbi:MAG TPA: hypothetical protein VL651_05500 [Bacteroidia bacterium]|jgi:hypothetical protein|nr:hypothetical protein [Bacteroidia bacterium]